MILKFESRICVVSHHEDLPRLHQGSGLHTNSWMKGMCEASTDGRFRERPWMPQVDENRPPFSLPTDAVAVWRLSSNLANHFHTLGGLEFVAKTCVAVSYMHLGYKYKFLERNPGRQDVERLATTRLVALKTANFMPPVRGTFLVDTDSIAIEMLA